LRYFLTHLELRQIHRLATRSLRDGPTGEYPPDGW
jgi:hypothetical protein